MKTYKKFISEAINISGNASVGTIIINGTDEPTPSSVGESFCADFMWQGNLYRMNLKSNTEDLPTREKLTEHIQNEYPGAIVHNIYPLTPVNNSYKVSDVKRYHPSKLEWID